MRSLGERCILSFGSSAGPPMIPLLYNNNYQIVQTPGLGADPRRDGARRARRAAEQQASAVQHPHVDGRLHRLVGGRHARRGDHELPPGPELPRQQPEPEGDRALHAHRSEPDPVPLHGRGPGHVHAAVQRRGRDERDRREDLRVRLPRRQLRAARNSRRCARAGAGSGARRNRRCRVGLQPDSC